MKNTIKTKLSQLIEIPKIHDEGYLCFAESERQIPFPIKRFYYISGVEHNAIRGLHAHKKTVQYMFCLQGRVTVVLDNGQERETIILNELNQGLLLDKMMWHEMKDFAKNTVLLVLASDYYEEKDYIRNYKEFLRLVAAKSHKRQSFWSLLPTMMAEKRSSL